MQSNNDSKIIVALDHLDVKQTKNLVAQLNPQDCRLKVGITLFIHYGPALIEDLMKQGFSIFLDLKFHDIPRQVAGACHIAAELGVWMVNVHIQGGRTMMEAAYNAISKTSSKNKPLLIGVTILTSFNDNDLQETGLNEKISVLVPRMAKLARDVGLDGVVCSSQEVATLRSQLGNKFILVTPGIRLAGGNHHDQKRIMTPKAAITAGSSYLVIGRCITGSENPGKTLQKIKDEINN